MFCFLDLFFPVFSYFCVLFVFCFDCWICLFFVPELFFDVCVLLFGFDVVCFFPPVSF